MFQYLIKIIVTAILIIAISEVSKRSSFVGGLLASIPLVSVLAMLWLYFETKDIAKISALSTSIFWLVIPSLALFICLPIFLRLGLHFFLSLSLSILTTAGCYYLLLVVLEKLGIEL